MGTRRAVCDLIISYLSERKIIVAIGKKTSKTSYISLRVQFWVLYLHVMASCFLTPNASVNLYADVTV